tara:strand:+ start:148 stop:537 length:390 start_codon:yes stop_codon:yes gene_type:complete
MVFDDDDVNQHFAENEDEENALIATLIFFAVYIVITTPVIAWYARKQAKYYIQTAQQADYPVSNGSEMCIWILLLFFNSFAIPVVWYRGDLPGQVNTKLAEINRQKSQPKDDAATLQVDIEKKSEVFRW